MYSNVKASRHRSSRLDSLSAIFGRINTAQCAQSAISQHPVKILTSTLYSATPIFQKGR